MKHLLRTFLASLAILIAIPILNVNADRQLNEEEAFRILQNAFKTQVALSEKPRSMEEVKESLDRYFTKEYTDDFIEMNVQENMEGEGYLAYGTGFALYYIPFFTYDENTKVGYDSDYDQWYVYEWFEESSDDLSAIMDTMRPSVLLLKMADGQSLTTRFNLIRMN